ncbi:MgtC/SapB family protein [Photobacterium aphoticum]|uniref:Membrane protein n=1 Tax=Photobacterium aphoticum TaxID=754436 RepID=A0A0J1GKW2_9GAMM|nr:MgtC/SapB family protein [Photobacterium aphoticum]KLV00241.1 membrane protein [Photobacterium aphoticum]PSU56609.1 MgtC/SapB family protein [Photobacterium aphoticum]GHA55811.1 membrane protein [Photobacterium aphoticum]
MDTGLDFSSPYIRLAIALLLGAIIGIQRGWVDRNEAAGSRIAGIRTYSLVGLLGGLCGLLADHFSELFLGLAFIALTVIVSVAYVSRLRWHNNLSITGLVGTLLTFLLGALAVIGDPVLAASSAVITAIILDNKKELHEALRKLQEYELDAALRLLLISVVMLPLLPNQAMGPWDAINPYEVWWMVVLIASISFVGYFAMKIGGTEKGILLTCLFAGLSSSTALTLQFSHLSKQQPPLSGLLASGILLSCGTMFPRILFVCSVVNWTLLERLWLPMLAMMLGFYVSAGWIWRTHQSDGQTSPEMKQNPLALTSALIFGVILMVIIVLANALQAWFGNAGTLLLAATSGITDVDAITLALGRQSALGVGTEAVEGAAHVGVTLAAMGIFIAAAVNSVVKMGMACVIGDSSMRKYVIMPILLSVVLGGVTLFASQG